MKSLPALCIRHSRFCIALGLIVASSTLVAVTSQAEETAQKDVSSSEETTKATEPRRLTHTSKKAKPDSLSDLVISRFKSTSKSKSFRPTQNKTTPTTVKQTAGEKSKVQKELEALYSQDGRQMPSMQLKDAPNTRSAQPATRSAQRPATPAVRQQPTKQAEPRRLQTQTQPQQRQYRQQPSSRYRQQRRYSKKPTFMQRLFGRKPSRQPYRYKPLPQQRVAQQPTLRMVPATSVPTKPQVAKKVPAATSPTVVARKYPVPPAPEVFTTEEKIEPKEELVNNEAPVTEPKKTVSNLDNPFPELSENETDGVKEEIKEVKAKAPRKPTPFTGLVLEDKPVEKQTIPGLKGFCIVTLRDKRQLVDAKDEFRTVYEGKAYIFSSKAAKSKFDASPALYAPVKGGSDAISLASGEEVEDGSLDFAVWYKSKLYLFNSQNNLQLFVQNPGKYHEVNTEK